VRNCCDCSWMKDLKDSMGRTIHFCMHTDGGNYLGETDICGWCDLEPEEEEDNDV